MDTNDNFRSHKNPHKKGKSIDGIDQNSTVNSGNFERQGSVGFENSKTNQAVPGSSQIGNFKRTDGFHPGVQPLINVAPRPIDKERISRHPRNMDAIPVAKHPKPKKQKKVRSRRRKFITRSILLATTLFILLGGFLGWKFMSNTFKIFGGGGIFGFLENSKLKGEDKGRVNILLAGNSEDDPGHAGAQLTDSIMIISLDTVNNTGFMMSIPRDLWVTYGPKTCAAGYEGKINAAYVCGDQIKFREAGYPDGGMGLLEKVVEQNFGIDINYYARINYTAFRDAVNAVGGIDITLKTNDPRGLYDSNISRADGGPLKLGNGLQHLNGQTALNLARARCESVCYGFTSGDFDRSEHQRKMLLSLKDKALSAGVLTNPAKISSLLDAVGNNVKTDFKTNEARRLNEVIKKISNTNIKSIGLGDKDVKLIMGANLNGTSIQRPVAGLDDFSQIKAFIKRLTSNDPVTREGATIVVLNGSGSSGLAQRKSKILSDKGLSVVATANASKPRSESIVISLHNNNKTATKTYLEQQFKVASSTDLGANPDAQKYDADFVIILGQNEAE